MYLRLWWKDARQFWPIWAFLVLAAGVTQDLVLRYAGPEARNGILALLALGWTSLYAVAVGAAAFAGEREAGTLRLLDILPASRQDVWAGKVSFAFGTTLVLAVALLAMAALGTDRWGPRRDVLAILEGLPLAGVVLQALGWGLFCSSVMSNALLAATAAICLTGLSSPTVVMRLDDLSRGRETGDPGQLALEQLMLVLVTVGASLIAFTWPRRPRRAPRPLAIRYLSPVVETWGGSPRPARRMSMQPRSPVVRVREPVPMPAVGPAVAVAADEPRPRSWRAEARALAWETIREGRPTWYVLAAIGLILPGALVIVSDGRIDPMPIAVWNWLVALTAGVSVFGLENRAGTARFLVHHGARPGIVWLAKLATWCFGLAVIWVPLAMLVASSPGRVGQRPGPEGLTIVLTIPLGFAVAQLCGMAIRRGITAGVVALVVATALAFTEGALVLSRMMSAWGLLVLPVALLGASWAWSDDWLFNRPAPGRWLRLGSILAGMFAVLLGGYTAERAWGIPDVGPIPPPLAWLVAAEPLPGERNAADLYREAGRLLGQLPTNTNIVIGSSPGTRKALERIRDAAAEPDCLFQRPARLTLFNLADLPPMDHLAELVIADARDRQQRGDLDGAWDDIAVVLRMARHTGEGATMSQARQALEIEKRALDLAMEWAAAPGQTPERLRGAIAAYRAWPRMIPAAEVVRAEATLIERTLELPAADLQSWLLDPMGRNRPNLAGVGTVLWGELITTPWERARAARANRSYALAAASIVAREPWHRPFGGITNPSGLAGLLATVVESTPLMKRLLPNIEPFLDADDRNEVARRALVQVLAIRAWQLRHGGRFPDRLEVLVPEELPSLPADPFSGQGFRYSTQAQSTQIEPSSWVKVAFLASVGPVRLGARSGAIFPGPAARSQLVFPIPPLQQDAGADTR